MSRSASKEIEIQIESGFEPDSISRIPARV